MSIRYATTSSLRMIWRIPRRHHSTTQYQGYSLSSLFFFEDLFEAINIQAVLVGEKKEPKPSITSPNKTNTCDGYDFDIDIINNDEYNAVQKESLMMFEGFCIFGFWEFFKHFFCMLMEVNKTMYGYNEDVTNKFFDNLYPESHLRDVIFAVVWNVLAADENNSVN
jgi:hypothetical protein